MAIFTDVTESVTAWNRAWSDLNQTIETKYPRGTRVSFKKFTYWGVDAPVVTGTVAWNSVKASDSSIRVYLKIMVDDEFKPFEMALSSANTDSVLLDIMNEQFDITVIG